MPLTAIAEEDFRRLVKFIHQYYGIDLSQKRQLVTSLRLPEGIPGLRPLCDGPP